MPLLPQNGGGGLLTSGSGGGAAGQRADHLASSQRKAWGLYSWPGTTKSCTLKEWAYFMLGVQKFTIFQPFSMFQGLEKAGEVGTRSCLMACHPAS